MKKIFKYQKYYAFFGFVLLLFSISVGYALYGKMFDFSGNVSLKPDGKLEIVNILIGDTSNVVSSDIPIIDGSNIQFNVVFGGQEDEFFVTYTMDVVNNSSYNYVFDAFDFIPTINSSGGGTGTLSLKVEGIEPNEIINPKETRSITLILSLEVSDKNQTYDANVSTNVNTDKQQSSGTLLLSANLLNGNMKEDRLASFEVNVINTYEEDIEASISSANQNFIVVDSNGNSVSSLVISASSENSYTYYLKTSDDSIFTSENASTVIYVRTDKGNFNAGTLNLQVDISEEKDTDIPEIGNVALVMLNDLNQARVTFSRLDTGGTDIINYTILLYNSNNNLVGTYNTNSAITEYTLTDLEEGSYYVVVYGEDAAGNTGSIHINSASLDNKYARKSSTVNMKWVFSVTNDLTNLSSNGAATVNIGTTYTATLTASGLLASLPDNLTSVTMGGVPLSSSDYTYTKSSGVVSIPNVTGDIVITATANTSCLVSGTLIKTYNGYKQIDDITYNDLLAVWNYETGSITYEYPIWIEKKGKSSYYQLIKFDDGTELKTVGYHGIFSVDLNRFVSVDNKDEFHVGTRVYKIINNRLSIVKVTSIEIVKEVVNYYHVVSTRFYDVIANDLLTTDGTVILSNLYGFDENIKWPSLRDEVINNNSQMYTYDDLNILPYYLYKGLRAGEGKYLSNYGLNLELFKYYLSMNQLNDTMWNKPILNSNGKREWMVTLSENNKLTSDIILEGGKYYLPYPNDKKRFNYWYNTSNGEKYSPGQFIDIWHGTYIEAIYK